MLATITPASHYIDETLATLRYACQARSIVNRARINEDPHDRLIRELRAEVERLRALRQDYEQRSIPSLHDESSNQERDELKLRLAEMEQDLEEAQKAWEKKFLETKQKQLEQLAEAEKKKAELESHLRVMSTLDTDISLSPYRSNFLNDLEDILTINETKTTIAEAKEIIKETKNWFEIFQLRNFEIDMGLSPNIIFVKDHTTNAIAKCSLEHLKSRCKFNGCPENFLNCLDWEDTDGNQKRNDSKNIISNYMEQIQNATNSLKPYLLEDDLTKNAFSQFSKAFENFEMAINRKNRSNLKTVKFDL